MINIRKIPDYFLKLHLQWYWLIPIMTKRPLLRKFRAVGDPNERYHEDALRMMRAVRISAQLGLSIEDRTLTGIKINASLIHKIAKERVGDELVKLLSSDYPAEGIMLLRNTGLLEQIIPELEKCFGVEQKSPGRHHIYDVGTHSVLALKHCPSKDPVRFATLVHDIGKPITYRKLKAEQSRSTTMRW
jgi:tRNA nucleotidyltransferase/poly(A) polymerase